MVQSFGLKLLWHAGLILLAWLPHSAYSQPREVTIAVGFSLEPYVFSNGNGIFNEIVEAALKDTPVTLSLAFMSNTDAIKAYNNNQYDAVAIVRPGMVVGFYSAPVITLQDKAILLANKPLSVNTVTQLKDYRVLGYSQAADYIGGQYQQVAQMTPAYKEVEHQSELVRALYFNEADIVISDEIIFRYYLRRLRYRNPEKLSVFYQKYAVKSLFDAVDYHIAFKDKATQTLFDKGLLRIKQQGIKEKIIHKYTRLIDRY